MAQNWTVKQANWVQRFSNATVALMTNADALTALCAEFAAETYGVGGANALTDSNVQTILPASTAVLVSEAEGALAGTNAVLATIASNRGYLELVRP